MCNGLIDLRYLRQVFVEADGLDLGADAEPVKLVPEGMDVESLERFLPAPLSFRHAFVTSRPPDFGAYVSAMGDDTKADAAVFVNLEVAVLRAVLDLGAPGDPKWGRHTAELNMRLTPFWKALQGLDGRPRIGKGDLVELIEDWGDLLTEGQSAAELLRTLVKTKVSVGRHVVAADAAHKQTRSAIRDLEISSEDGVLPDLLTFEAPLFEHCQAYPIRCTLKSVTTSDDDEVRFRLRIIGRDTLRDQAVRDTADGVLAELGDGWRVFYGTLK